MTDSSRSPAEQQLRQRLQQAAMNQAERELPLSWPARKSPQRWWAWSLIPVASAAAVGWMMFTGTSLWHLPQATDDAAHGDTVPPMLMAENYQLEALDQRIQQAYLTGADEHTISQLWQQREYWTAKDRINQEWTQ